MTAVRGMVKRVKVDGWSEKKSGLGKIRKDSASGCDRIFGFKNGPTNNDITGTGTGGVGRGHDAFLVVAIGFASGADAWCYKLKIRGELAA